MSIRLYILILFLFAQKISAQTVTNTYDNLGRLTKAAYSDSTIITYIYDGSGNRIGTNAENVCLINPKHSTISSGNWNNPSIWRCGNIPSINDSAIVSTGHSVIVDNSVQVRKLYIENSGSLLLNDSNLTFTVGNNLNKTSPVICEGSLLIRKGIFKINGNLIMTSTAQYDMNGGRLIIDGNTGQVSSSIPDWENLFNVATTAANFNFSGGILQFVNPPLGAHSQTISCPYNFGLLSTVAFGDGVSTTASYNPNGFGGDLLPSQMGKFVFDPVIDSNNRIFKNINQLTVNKDIQILSGKLETGALFHAIDSVPSVKDIDGNSYPIVTICNQDWTGKNLAVSHYRNGDTILQVQSSAAWAALTTGAWCYYQSNSANGPIYGKLYNWYAVNDPRGLAPAGWHIPTNTEWVLLADSCLGGTSVAGGKMKTPGLLSNGTGLWAGSINNSTNSSEFSGKPSGLCSPAGVFISLGASAFWWSGTPNTTTTASFREADQQDDTLYSGINNKKIGMAIRCVKD